MPDVILRYKPSAVKWPELDPLLPEFAVIIGEETGFPPEHIAIQRSKIKGGINLFDLDIYMFNAMKISDWQTQFHSVRNLTTRIEYDHHSTARFARSSNPISDRIEKLLEDNGLNLEHAHEGRPVTGVHEVGFGTMTGPGLWVQRSLGGIAGP